MFDWFWSRPQPRVLKSQTSDRTIMRCMKDILIELQILHKVKKEIHNNIRLEYFRIDTTSHRASIATMTRPVQRSKWIDELIPYGSLKYSPPEIFKTDLRDPERADIYAFGLVFYEIVSKKSLKRSIQDILSNKKYNLQNEKCDIVIKTVITLALSNINCRPTAEGLLKLLPYYLFSFF
jgi:hypothetical protein